MSSAYCLCSEEPWQELAWGCSPGAVRQVYGKLSGDLLQQQQLLTSFLVKAKSLAWCAQGEGRLARVLVQTTGRQLAQVTG